LAIARALTLGEGARDDGREIALDPRELAERRAGRGLEEIDRVAQVDEALVHRAERAGGVDRGLELVGRLDLSIETDGQRRLHVRAHAIARVETDRDLARQGLVGVAPSVDAPRVAHRHAIAPGGRLSHRVLRARDPRGERAADALEELGSGREHPQDRATEIAREAALLERSQRALGAGAVSRARRFEELERRARAHVAAADLETFALAARPQELEGERIGELDDPGRVTELRDLGERALRAATNGDPSGEQLSRGEVFGGCSRVEVRGGAVFVVGDQRELRETELASRDLGARVALWLHATLADEHAHRAGVVADPGERSRESDRGDRPCVRCCGFERALPRLDRRREPGPQGSRALRDSHAPLILVQFPNVGADSLW
jgi:hypothetical protein